MVGYGEMPCHRASADGIWPLIGRTQKRHTWQSGCPCLWVSACTSPQLGATRPLAEHYRDRLGRTANGKGCIRFRRLADIDRAVFAEAIHDAVAWAAVQDEHFGDEQFGRTCAGPVE